MTKMNWIVTDEVFPVMVVKHYDQYIGMFRVDGF